MFEEGETRNTRLRIYGKMWDIYVPEALFGLKGMSSLIERYFQ